MDKFPLFSLLPPVPWVCLIVTVHRPQKEKIQEPRRRSAMAGNKRKTRKKLASSPESVGEFWFGQDSKVVIEGGFNSFVGAKAVRFSGSQFYFVVPVVDQMGPR